MTREEAIKIIKECKEKGFKYTFYTIEEYHTALDMAIKALEQEPCEEELDFVQEHKKISCNLIVEPCEDAVSRQGEQMDFPDTFEEFAEQYQIIDKEEVYTNGIELIPVFRVKQWLVHIKTGHWIPVGYDGYADGSPVIDEWECSNCGYEHYGDDQTLTAFCPCCGCEMTEEIENE